MTTVLRDYLSGEKLVYGKLIGFKSMRGYAMKPKEVGAVLRKSERWVNKHIKNKTFPLKVYQVGPSCRFFDSADLDDLLKESKTKN